MKDLFDQPCFLAVVTTPSRRPTGPRVGLGLYRPGS